MEIQRIDTYEDTRFSQTVLHQHGCFLADGKPYEVEVISDHEATIRGENQTVYTAVAEEFRFYTPHITRFYDRDGKIVKEYPPVQVLTLRLEQIQPSQFFVDADKIEAVRSFIHTPPGYYYSGASKQGSFHFAGWAYPVIVCGNERLEICPGGSCTF